MTLTERVEQLKKDQPQVRQTVERIAAHATMRAIERAAELTPPTGTDLKGTNTRSGELKQHWATDSVYVPERQGHDLVTVLANDKEYASYVNDGYRMDRHFVPGLYVNPHSGLLEYDPSRKVGLVVGTKTAYVKGLHMVDAAKQEYEKAVQAGARELEELLK